jgi:hypothetical protein
MCPSSLGFDCFSIASRIMENGFIGGQAIGESHVSNPVGLSTKCENGAHEKRAVLAGTLQRSIGLLEPETLLLVE